MATYKPIARKTTTVYKKETDYSWLLVVIIATALIGMFN